MTPTPAPPPPKKERRKIIKKGKIHSIILKGKIHSPKTLALAMNP
jgi:hypothetical protein